MQQFSSSQLENNILPFWRNIAADKERGGFYGQIENDLSIARDAEKGLILNARILWSFSAVYLKYHHKVDLETADRAYDYILTFFHDHQYEGYYWSLNPDGSPKDTKKQIYAQAFTIYALAEYFKVKQQEKILQEAIKLFRLIEEKSFDREKNGYIEARNRQWEEMADIRLSAKDMNEKKSMNTHLHILEAYANLYRVWKDPFLKKQIDNLICLFTDKIFNQTDFHQILFFNDDWEPRSSIISFGHDIEASWLLHEAALVSGDKKLIRKVTQLCIKICDAVKEGLAPSGALHYESDRNKKHYENEIEWWAQAEGVVGYLNAYSLTGKKQYLDIACNLLDFIDKYVVDHKKGEWFFRVTDTGVPILTHEKAGFWKCPYHNTRACLEIIHRSDLILNQNN